MSIVALKRKSKRFITPISHFNPTLGNKNGFALNGTLRNVGWVGQTNLSRSSTASRCIAEDNTIVKKSTQNTLGHLSARVRYPVSDGCSNGKCDVLFKGMNESKKLTFISGDHTAGGQTASVARSVETCPENSLCNNRVKNINNNSVNKFKSKLDCSPDCNAGSYYIGGRLVFNKHYSKNVESFSAISAGDYIRRIQVKNTITKGTIPIAN